MFLYHASPVSGIQVLEPRVSNHGVPLIYFSEKRENVLVYLSNAVEKYCRETGFAYDGIWQKWGPYGFTKDGVLRLEEYYPNATYQTYAGVKAYIYRVEKTDQMKKLGDIPYAYTSDVPVPVVSCEVIDDAYKAICDAVTQKKIELLRFEELTPKQLAWSSNAAAEEYQNAVDHPEYQHFLKAKFPDVCK